MKKQDLIGRFARYMSANGSYYDAQVKDILPNNTVVLTHMPNGARAFTRKLDELVFFMPCTDIVPQIGSNVFYRNGRKYEPAVVESIESDPLNGTMVQIRIAKRVSRNGKTDYVSDILEVGIHRIGQPVVYDAKTKMFKAMDYENVPQF